MSLMNSIQGSSAPGKGILWMMGAGALLTMNDAVLKWLAASYPVGQLMFMRGIFVFIPIFLLVRYAGGLESLRIHNPKVHIVRAGLVICGTILFINGLRFLPLADAIAIAFAGPLFITALAPLVIGEQVGWRRWLAVLIGFVGVMIIIRPGSEVMQMAALLPLCAAFTGALRDLITRGASATETSNAMLFTTTSAVTLAGLVSASLGNWAPLNTADLPLLALSGCLMGGAHFLMIDAFRHGEAALIAPFKYSSMIFAVALGYLFWGDLPDLYTWAGTAVVISSGIYILHRERVRKALETRDAHKL